MWWRAWVPVLLWGLLILVLLLMPPSAVPGGGLLGRFHLDKVVHAGLFGVFSILIVRAMGRGPEQVRPSVRTLSIAALMAIVHGALTEMLQELSANGRRGDLWDLLADTIGVILAMVLLLWGPVGWTHFLKRRERYF
jgi:hypothetical protein